MTGTAAPVSERASGEMSARVQASFARQGVMALLGAELHVAAPGKVEIRLPYRAELTQQNGYLHAGIATTIADSAGGYAAYSLFEPGEDVLTSEFKMNFLAPAAGDYYVATGTVLKPGRRLTVCQVEVHGWRGGTATLCVVGLLTAVRIAPR